MGLCSVLYCPYPLTTRATMKSETDQKEKFYLPFTGQYINVEKGRDEHHFLSRTCYEKIITGGLDFAFHCHHGNTTPQTQTKTQTPRKVVVVGAGLAGLSAAYELSQAGHEVTILERQNRVGGRVKTIRHPLTDGLHAEVGPIRIPDRHYLDFHYLNLFGINTKPFIQKNCKTFYWVYGERVKVADWNERPGYYCDKFWNGWDANLSAEVKERLGIVDINTYVLKTIQPILEELKEADVSDTIDLWCRKWSTMSMTGFLRSEDSGSDKLRPWPEIAIKGLDVVNYSIDNEASMHQIVKILYYDIYESNLSCVTDGMGRLPEAFVKKNKNGWNKDVELSQRIRYGTKVKQVELSEGRVKVIGEDVTIKHEEVITGDAVIITVPLTVLRRMDISFPLDKMRAIGGVGYCQSTKILLQCRTQFWLKHYGINGGFSVTNLPIGQLQYPIWNGNPSSFDQRGVLTVFNFHGDSLFFAGLSDEEAIETAVDQVAKIHPEILDEFEIGFVQTWGKDPTTQGGTALYMPGQFKFATATLIRPDHPIYLAGEALSLNNGWMQGALESGLTAAYQFYSHNELN